MNWNNYDTKYIIKRLIIGFGMLILFSILTTRKASALTYTPGGTYYTLGTGWRSKTKQSLSYSNNAYWVIQPEGYAVGLLYEYGLPTGSGQLQFSVIFQGQVATVPQANVVLENKTIYCMTSVQTAYGTTNVVNYFCDNYDFSSGYNAIGLTWEWSSNNPQLSYIGLSKNIDLGDGGAGQAHQDSVNTQQKIDNINNSINNDNVNGANGDFDNFKNNSDFSDSTGLQAVIELPLNLVSSFSNTCQPISITIPFIDYTGTIPCMSTIYRQHFNSLYSVVAVIVNAFFVYRILLKIYEIVHNAKQPDEDKLEVIDL